ncbi:MAG: hypothetical protein ABIO70_04800 [Pseudomonadota bacterium]
MLTAALALLLACGHRAPVTWAAPAAPATPEGCAPAPDAIAVELHAGLRLSGDEAAALFPDLGLIASWVGRASLRAGEARLCDGRLVVRDPELRFWNGRGEPLDVALITDVMVHPRLILALRREDVPPPPDGAWIPLDATGLRRVGWCVVGEYGGRSSGG